MLRKWLLPREMEGADVGEDGHERRDAAGASQEQVYRIVLTLDPASSEFELNGNFPGAVLQLGMLEYAVALVKSQIGLHVARGGPRVVSVFGALPVKR